MTTSGSTAAEGADELSLLMQHYETSFAITQGRERIRDWTSWVVVSLSIALTLVVFTDMFAAPQPPRGGWLWMAYALQGWGLEFVIWTVILVATVRHMQVASRIEADYSYLHKLETHLNERMSWTFCRERIGYVPEFPLPSSRKGYSVLYKLLVPTFVVAQTSAAVISGWMNAPLDLTPESLAEMTSLVAATAWSVTTYLLLKPIGSL